MRLLRLALVSALICGSAACGPRPAVRYPAGETPLSAAEVDAARREYYGLPRRTEARRALRDRLIAYGETLVDPLIEAGEYDALVAQLAWFSDLLMPEDFEERIHAEGLARLAKAIVVAGSRRGDEARVLAALRLIQWTDAPQTYGERNQSVDESYAEIERWGQESRAEIPSRLDALARLLRIWDEHARLSPAAGVIQHLTRLHATRLTELLAQPRPGEDAMQLLLAARNRERLEMVPFELAGIYLRLGELQAAHDVVDAIGNPTQYSDSLLRALLVAGRDDGEAVEALGELAHFYARAAPQVAEGICKEGLRRFPEEASFPLCLAQLTMNEAPADAAAWRARAAELLDEESLPPAAP